MEWKSRRVGLPAESAGERGLKLLSVLAYVFSAHFQHTTILNHMIALLGSDQDYAAPYILKAFTYLGRYKPLVDSHPAVLQRLTPICKELAISGTPKQAKHAVRCMYVNMTSSVGSEGQNSEAGDVFAEIVETLKVNLSPEQAKYRTAIVCLGHIAYNIPDRFHVPIKNIISRKIVKELLVKDVPEDRKDIPSTECFLEIITRV
uniref:Uncharacterized protein n=1 Tax=Phlebotomus papatasi TaxID=29031 RepID=A0A1B0D150_PHLPP